VKSLLAIADGGPALVPALTAAAAWAKLLDAELDVLHVRDTEAARAAAFEDSTIDAGVTSGPEITFVSNRAKAAHTAFDELCRGGAIASWSEDHGDEATIIARRARLADLTIVGRPGADADKLEPAYVHAILFDSGRPALIIPPRTTTVALSTIVVAWNGSAQSARSLGYSLPLLQRAGRVIVLSLDAPNRQPATADVLIYLERHGITADTDSFDPGSGSARARGRALLGYVDDCKADMLVMGAYGEHGILKFLGLGGATGKVITACKVPLFLAH